MFAKLLASLGWKTAAIFAVVLNLAMGVAIIYTHMQLRMVTEQRNTFQSEITNPDTGYIARLSRSQSNVAVLTGQLENQARRYRAEAEAAERELERTRRDLQQAQSATRAAQRRIDAFRAEEIEGDTLEERILDVDRRALEEFINVP